MGGPGNIKNNPPGGPGVGPTGTQPHGGPHDNPQPGGPKRGAQPDPSRGQGNGVVNPDHPTRTRGHGNDKHPRVQDVLNNGKQRLEQVLNRTGDAVEGLTRGLRGEGPLPPGQAKKLLDGGRAELPDNPGRPNDSQRYDYSGDGRRTPGPGNDDHGHGNFRPASSNSGNGNGNDFGNRNGVGPSHGRGPHDARGVVTDRPGGPDIASVVAHLRGDAGGARLPRELRQVLDSASRLLGPDLVAALERRGGSHGAEHSVKFIEHALARVARTLERVTEAGGSAASNVAPRVLKDAVGELVQATMLDKYFRRAERTVGHVATQAEAALARLLYGNGRDEGGRGRTPVGFEFPQRTGLPAPHPLEVLRDLQAGAFRPPDVSRSPFPLSGRALVATEMMELMRTLDAVERVTRELLTAMRGGGASASGVPVAADGDEAPLVALLRALSGTGGGAEMMDELLSLLPPTLPGRAARLEIPRLVAMLGGVLVDAEGHAFVTKDGVPLKLDQLLWLGDLGGVLKSLAGGAAESFPVRLSPLLLFGFDAVYSLIGFDGRTLNPPHFAAVQAQINGSDLEWVFGQPPLSEGWMRALIERLKDSAQADHNLLGEMLEEALSEGRFHAALVGGTVSEGEAEPDTFAVTRLLPGTTLDTAFSPA